MKTRSLRQLSTLVVATTLATALAAGPTHAQAPQSKINRLLELSPGLSKQQLEEDIRAYASETHRTFNEVLDQALRGAEEAELDGQPSSERAANKTVTSPTGKQATLPKVTVGGDIFFQPASTLGIKHGHVGIYSRKDHIVEAPGRGKLSHEISHSRKDAVAGTQLLYVDTHEPARTKAGNYARYNLVGKPYNYNFAVNKNAYAKRMNCSQLVWAAFKVSSRIDLDGNGGPGVYPKDILNSSKTKTWRRY